MFNRRNVLLGKLQTFDMNFKCCMNALNNTKLFSFLPPDLVLPDDANVDTIGRARATRKSFNNCCFTFAAVDLGPYKQY